MVRGISVYSLTILIATGVISLLGGLGIGLFLGRSTSTDSQRLRETERKLDQLAQDKRVYEEEVVEHFTQTAALLNSLTDSYRNVHNHLASGAEALCQEHGPVALGRLQQEGRADDAEIPAHLARIQPPLDYAPKSSPEEKGMLNEEFGIDRTRRRETHDTDD